MADFEKQVSEWLQLGHRVAVATVVGARQPSPRDTGARMALSDHGGVAGSVTWGCVEGAVMEEARQVLQSGEPRMLHFGTVTDTTFEVGLTCGGDMDIHVERLDPHSWPTLQQTIEGMLLGGKPSATITVTAGPPETLGFKLLLDASGNLIAGSTTSEAEHQFASDFAAAAMPQLHSGSSGLKNAGDMQIFIDVHQPPPRVVIVGAGHVSISLVAFARTLGYHTFVIDPRTSILTPERFAHATRTFPEWPTTALQKIPLDGLTYLVLLTHDEKLDDPAIKIGIQHDIPYIGALGSRRTHEKRIARLRQAGLTDAQLSRLHAPVGLNLGGRDPEEIALSIMAEIVQVRRGGQVQGA